MKPLRAIDMAIFLAVSAAYTELRILRVHGAVEVAHGIYAAACYFGALVALTVAVRGSMRQP